MSHQPGTNLGTHVLGSSRSSSSSKNNIRILITAFGPFGSVDSNPTEALLKQFKHALVNIKASTKWLEFADFDCKVLEVSCHSVDACLTACGGDTRVKYDLRIHLGVHAGSDNWNLESRGLNFLHLGSRPDVKGSTITGDIVKGGRRQIFSDMPLTQLLAFMHDGGFKSVAMSTCAGTYLCNYIYYKSLVQSTDTVFIHIPSFETLSAETQFKYLLRTVEFFVCANRPGGRGSLSGGNRVSDQKAWNIPSNLESKAGVDAARSTETDKT
jgi:pyrrolidone-carboxylate peptidase